MTPGLPPRGRGGPMLSSIASASPQLKIGDRGETLRMGEENWTMRLLSIMFSTRNCRCGEVWAAAAPCRGWIH